MQEENTWIEKDLYSSSFTVSGEIRFHPKTFVLIIGHHRVGTVVASDLWMTAKCKQKNSWGNYLHTVTY